MNINNEMSHVEKKDYREKRITDSDCVVETFSAGGPGGSGKDTGNTAVRVRVRIVFLRQFSEEEKEILRRFLPLTKTDELIVKEESQRSQPQNKATAIERINFMIHRAFEEYEAEQKQKSRRPIEPSLADKERKRQVKENRKHIKKGRQRVKEDYDYE